jgi:hypothetical protein
MRGLLLFFAIKFGNLLPSGLPNRGSGDFNRGGFMIKKIYLAASFLIIIGQTLPLLAAQVNISGWFLTTDASGNVTSMQLLTPKTNLMIESSIEIFLDSQKIPTRGRVKFNNGVERDLTPAEVINFWINYGGQHAMWEYFALSGKVDSFHPDNALIPPQWYDRLTRVISKSGKEYIGKTEKIVDNPDWLVVNIDGSAVTVYRHAIAEMQQLK